MSTQLIQSDARSIPLADNSIQCCVTSPPYWGLRDYGVEDQIGLEPTPEEYVANLVVVFREVRRVLRDDGTVWLNLGDSYAASQSGLRGDPSKSTLTGGGGRYRSGSKHEAMFNNSAPVRRESNGVGVKPKDLIGIPWRVAFALQADGWYLRSDIIWQKPNALPESVTDRPTKAHEYLFLLTKSRRYYYDYESIKEPAVTPSKSNPSPRRGNKQDALGKTTYTDFNSRYDFENPPALRNRRTVWTIPTQPYKGAHFATFPEALVEPCILAGSRESDTILDPFCGSGTVGVVCKRHNRNFVGIDINPDYLALALSRIDPL